MGEIFVPAVVGLVSALLGTVFGVWWQRRDSRAEWLRVLRFDQFVELDRRLRELVALAARGFELADEASMLQVQAREAEQRARDVGAREPESAVKEHLELAIALHQSIIELAPRYHEARTGAQAQLRQLELDMGRYVLLLSAPARKAVGELLGLLGDLLAQDLTKSWVDVAELESRAGLEALAQTAADRAERERTMAQDRVELLREGIAISQREFLDATMKNLRIPRTG